MPLKDKWSILLLVKKFKTRLKNSIWAKKLPDVITVNWPELWPLQIVTL